MSACSTENAIAPGNPKPLCVSMKEFQRLLGIKHDSAYALIHAGEVESIKLGKSRRVIYASIVQLIERRKAASG